MTKKIFTIILVFLTLLTSITNIKADQINFIDENQLESQVFLAFDRKTKKVLTHYNGYKKIAPASLTKTLTVITALELIEEDLGTHYQLPKEVFETLNPIASVAGFKIDEKVSLEEILYGILLPSGADATRAISYYLTKSPEGLAQNMNDLSKKIGMQSSHFANTSGLDDENHYSTAYDLALLLDYALDNSFFKKMYQRTNYQTRANNIHPEGLQFNNLSLSTALAKDNRYIKGAKSGQTAKAGFALSSFAEYKGQEVIVISVEAFDSNKHYQAPIQDALLAYDLIFNNYHQRKVIEKNEILGTQRITLAKDYQYILQDDLYLYLPIDVSTKDLTIDIDKEARKFHAPLKIGTKMGTLVISYQDEIIYEEEFILEEAINIDFISVLKTLILSLMILIFIIYLTKKSMIL